MIVKLAWRNIWRNKRRTLITAFSVTMAVFLSILTRSMQFGSYDKMIQDIAGTFTGYIQIHQKGYWDKQTLNNSFAQSDSLDKVIASQSGITAVVPRLQSYVLASGTHNSRAAFVIGIDPKAEKDLSEPQKRLVKGKYFTSNNEDGVLIAQGLAKQLQLTVGDTLVLLGQGYHGQSAAGKYPIMGIDKIPQPDLNDVLIYLPLQQARTLFGAYNRLTAVALVLNKADDVPIMAKNLKKELPSHYEVMTWQKMMPELVQAIQADNSGGIIMLMVIYMIVGFGILGTILMMTAERKYELGIMIAVGMHRFRLGLTLLMESLFLALIGALVGILISLPVIWYFHLHPIYLTGNLAKGIETMGMEPILPFSVDPRILIDQALIVLGMTGLVALYPVWFTLRLKVNTAIRP